VIPFIRRSLKRALLSAAPALAPVWIMRLQVLSLRRQSSPARLKEAVHLACTHHVFNAMQKESEILRVLERVRLEKPKVFCEIGGLSGGTLFLFCTALPAGARALSVDLKYTPSQLAAQPLFARSGQQVSCMQANSHAPETLQRIREWLGGQKLDFLFIDGDHTYGGVLNDFRMYAPLVREGGSIAFHDIMQDFKTRYGKETWAWTGEVPVFWSRLKQAYPDQTTEIVEDSGQDGLGIGLLRWEGRLKDIPTAP